MPEFLCRAISVSFLEAVRRERDVGGGVLVVYQSRVSRVRRALLCVCLSLMPVMLSVSEL